MSSQIFSRSEDDPYRELEEWEPDEVPWYDVEESNDRVDIGWAYCRVLLKILEVNVAEAKDKWYEIPANLFQDVKVGPWPIE